MTLVRVIIDIIIFFVPFIATGAVVHQKLPPLVPPKKFTTV